MLKLVHLGVRGKQVQKSKYFNVYFSELAHYRLISGIMIFQQTVRRKHFLNMLKLWYLKSAKTEGTTALAEGTEIIRIYSTYAYFR